MNMFTSNMYVRVRFRNELMWILCWTFRYRRVHLL